MTGFWYRAPCNLVEDRRTASIFRAMRYQPLKRRCTSLRRRHIIAGCHLHARAGLLATVVVIIIISVVPLGT
jgi:hypothetical protein